MGKNSLLLNPYSCKGYYSNISVQWKSRSNLLHTPIYLIALATFLKKEGINISFLDAAGENLNFQENIKKAIKNSPEYIITKTHFSTWQLEKELINAIKEKTGATVISVGVHSTLVPDRILRDSKIDIAVRNEPELTCSEILKDNDLKKIKGISYKTKDKIIHNPNRKFIKNLNSLPYPVRNLLPHQNYRLSNSRKKPVTVVVTGRGCSFSCSHCSQRVFWNSPRRVRSAENVIGELKQLYKEGYKEVSFEDQVMECDKRLVKIAKYLGTTDIVWKFGTRPDLLNKEALKICKENGCYEIYLGIESGSDSCLKEINKNITVEQIKKAFDLCKRFKIQTNATFMIGYPNETKEKAKKTIDLALKCNPDYATFYCLTPLPKTPIYKIYKKNNLLVNQNWDFIDFNNTQTRTNYLSTIEIEALISQAYKSFYMRPRYLIKKLKELRLQTLKTTISSALNMLGSLYDKRTSDKKKRILKDKIIEEAKKEYTQIEDAEDEKDARRKSLDYRRKGIYTAIPLKEGGSWKVYVK